jgi:transposase
MPAIVITLFAAYQAQLLDWFSEWAYRRLLERNQEDLLVCIKPNVDLTPVIAACQGYHKNNGQGSPVEHSVEQLVPAILVMWLFDWSDRQLEWHIRYNLVVKWFVGYKLFDVGPDHSTISRFIQWVAEHDVKVYFDAVLEQIYGSGEADRNGPQTADTFGMRANVACVSLVNKIRGATHKLLRTLAGIDELLHDDLMAELEMEALLGTPDEVRLDKLNKQAKEERLRVTTEAALICAQVTEEYLTNLPAHALTAEEHAEMEQRVAVVRKVVEDEVEMKWNEAGLVEQVMKKDKKHKGEKRIVNTSDEEATFRVHGKKSDPAYNISLTQGDEGFVRTIHTETGCSPDPEPVAEILAEQAERHNAHPSKLRGDAIYGRGPTRAEAKENGVEIVAPVIEPANPQHLFTPRDFTLSPDGHTLTCPEGHPTERHSRSSKDDGQVWRFDAGCATCSQRSQCTQGKGPRQVFQSDYREEMAAARAYQQTLAYKQDMRIRAQVEGKVADLTRNHGQRRCRYRGKQMAAFQAAMGATAANVKLFIAKLATQGRLRLAFE